MAAKTRTGTKSRAAKSGGGVKQVGSVDPDNAGHQFWGDIERQVDVFRPKRGGQPIAGVVGQIHSFARSAKSCGDQYGAEYFFLHQARRAVQSGDQRRRVKTA